MVNFTIKKHDEKGMLILAAIHPVLNVNYGRYQTASSFSDDTTLEGGGDDVIHSSVFIKEGRQIALIDVRRKYCRELKRSFFGRCKVACRLSVVFPLFV